MIRGRGRMCYIAFNLRSKSIHEQKEKQIACGKRKRIVETVFLMTACFVQILER